ncbi:MAG TPA: pyrrolo-quinoline quinone [Candidatus Binatia bacterium]|nr:pyrrolo-quinoline quinone [Candidatus Binatia bacterium]
MATTTCLSTRTSTLAAACLLLTASSFTQDVLTYHNNIARTGLYNKEVTLTTANVNSTTFGKLFTLPADGLVDAEPLYISSVAIAGVTHNLVIVATEHGTMYAYDADSGANLWHVTTLKSGETTSDNRGCSQVTPEIGITSTPVIQRSKTGNPVIFVVAMSKDKSGNYHQRLHALDATTGAEVRGGPVDIAATYSGTGDNSSGGKVIFDPAQYKERAGLLLTGNIVYLAWASHCDFRPYTGWIMGYNATTLVLRTVLNVTPNGNEGAVWNSGAGMAADGTGNVFLLDANGVFDTTLTASGFPVDGDYGNAFLRVTIKGGLAVADYFEMDNEASENASDTDLGSGGTLLVSQKDSSGKTWQLAIGAGKDSNLYVVDRTNMGKFNPSSNNVYQELPGALPGGVWSMPAFFNGFLYYGPVGSPLLAFQFKNAKLLTSPVAKTANSFGYPGTTPSISSNGGKNAIVWAMENSNPGVLHAYDARTLLELYNSNQAANSRDHFGAGGKFMTPMIANGRVYVANPTGVTVFGLLP